MFFSSFYIFIEFLEFSEIDPLKMCKIVQGVKIINKRERERGTEKQLLKIISLIRQLAFKVTVVYLYISTTTMLGS